VSFFKEKKNLPIIIGVVVVLVVGGAVAGLYFAGMLPWSPNAQSAANPPPPPVTPAPTAAPSAAPVAKSKPLGGTAPLAAAAAAKRKQLALAKAAKARAAKGIPVVYVAPKDITKGTDPFKIPPAAFASVLPPVWHSSAPPVPAIYIARYPPPVVSGAGPTVNARPLSIEMAGTQVLASARVSGVIQTDTGVQAILEDNGQSQAVQPGDEVAEGKVISIQSDGLTLKLGNGSIVRVPLAAGNPEPTPTEPTTAAGGPPWQGNGAPPWQGNGAPPWQGNGTPPWK
jgi:hypothetical protein